MVRAAETPATGQKATGQGLADGPEEEWGLADVAWPMAWLNRICTLSGPGV